MENANAHALRHLPQPYAVDLSALVRQGNPGASPLEHPLVDGGSGCCDVMVGNVSTRRNHWMVVRNPQHSQRNRMDIRNHSPLRSVHLQRSATYLQDAECDTKVRDLDNARLLLRLNLLSVDDAPRRARCELFH